jgi:protoporphyrinogen oxidase
MTHNTSNNSPGTSVFDCIVIGGGISGISFAYQAANSGDSVLVLEAEKSVGGQIDTFAPKRYPDFWTELGAHTCYNSYTRLLSIVTDSALQRDLLPLDKCSYILHNGRHLKSVASQLSYLPLIAHGWRMFSFSREGKTVKQAFRPVVGASNYDKLFRRLFRAVICQDADEYPAVFFLKKRKERNKEMPRKYSFSKGLSSLLQAMTEKGGFSVRTNSGAAKVTLADGIYSVETSAGETFRSRNIALATNPQIASQLTADIEPEVSARLKTIGLFESEAMTVIVDKDRLTLQKVAGIIPVSDEFLSAVSRDAAEHPRLRGFTFHFYKGQKTETEKLRLIRTVLNIDEKDILETAAKLHVLPSPRLEHTDIIEQVEALRRQKHTFFLGNYYYGLSLEDCIHRSADECARYRAANRASV